MGCAAPAQTEMCTLVNHDLRAHWEAIVRAWGNWAGNCGDFEVMHKWALKQFVRVVPHGLYFSTHLAHRHLAQFAYGAPTAEEAAAARAPPPAPKQLRFCRCEECQAKPGFHKHHVHVRMPGLAQEEDDEGRLHMLDRERSVTVLHVDQQPRAFQRALLRLMAEVQGTPSRHTAMPDRVYRANYMKLSWHDAAGKKTHSDTFHASKDFYMGPWFDALNAKHIVVQAGPARCFGGGAMRRARVIVWSQYGHLFCTWHNNAQAHAARAELPGAEG